MLLRKFRKILKWFFLSLLLLIVAVWVFIQTPFGQNWLVGKVTARLSKDLNTSISIRHVDFSLFNRMHLEGILVRDHNQDTLLYAGDAKLRITDWFFFKKNIELKYIGLENAVIHMNRKDSVWNYQFLVDYFSPSSSSGPKKQGGTRLNIKKLDLKNIMFVKSDAWAGEDMTVSFSALDLDANKIDISGKAIDLNYLTLNDPIIKLYSYTGLQPSAPDTGMAEEPQPPAPDSLLKWNAAGWTLQAGKLQITNGIFITDKESKTPVLPGFDGRHIGFQQINTTLTRIRWEKDTITTHLALQTKERSGFEVKDMQAEVKLTPQEMSFSSLNIRTNNSVIRDYFRMSFDDFSSMGDFIHQVRMQAHFDNSAIDSDDIAFFAPALKTWKKNITINGTLRGMVDDLVGKNLLIQAGHNTLLNGDISLTGLPDINQTFIDFKANDFRTTYGDAISFLPAIRRITSPDLRRLQYLRFHGSFTGFITDFVTYGTLQTALGSVKSDLNMKLPAGGSPIYSGTLSTDYFRLGDFIGEPQLGIISMNGSLRGKGFDARNRQSELDGKVNFIDYNGYRYHNIVMKGTLDRKMFNGTASINDPEAELTLNGLIDFNDSIPVFNFLADVRKANLKNLKLLQEDIAFTGKFDLNFAGNNIDNFLGQARITDASLLRNGEPLPFDSLIISADRTADGRTLKASSNEFAATVSGNFTIRDLPDAFRLFLHRYYPSYIEAPRKMPENVSLAFDLTTGYVDQYLLLADSSLTGFNNSQIRGSLNTATSELTLDANIPQFKYNRYSFDDVQLAARGDATNLALSGSAANIVISDSLNIPLAVFDINARNDSSKVRIKTGANQAIYQASLNAEVMTYSNGVRIEFDPSSFVVNGKTWTIDESGQLEFRSKVPVTGLLVLRESNQEIRVRSVPSERGTWNDLAVELKKVNLGDFAPFLLPNNRLEGLLSGNILVEDPTDNLYASSDDIQAEGLRLDNDSIGNLQARLTYNGKTQQLKVNGNTLDPASNLAFDLNLFLKQEQQKDNLIAIRANQFSIKILERFLGTLFSDMQGFITGDFDIRGEFDKLQITGKGRLKDAGLKVNFTQCFYKIQDTDIELKPTEINLDGIRLTDPVTGNPIYLTGGIQHNSFKDMFFDVVVSTRKPNTTNPLDNRPVLLLNTGFKDNQQFYGRVKGTGSFSLSGPQSDMFMKIDAIASTTDTSQVTIPSSRNRESGIADFLVERKYGREMTDSSFSASSNVTYDVDVTANPMVTVRVVLDDLTGDEIKGKGSGTLNIHSGTNEKLNLRGRFDIEQGDYLFTFQSFFKKPFVLRKGTNTNYISWNGDPYAAQIGFEAVYTAQKVSFAPLADVLQDASYSRLREDVDVVAHLTGQLFKPDFKFKLELPANTQSGNNFTIASNLQQIGKNENELIRQVTYLIVFNSFAPPEANQNTGIGSAFNEFTYSTISSLSGLFFNEINRKLNTELAKILKTDNISVNFSGSVYNRNLLDQRSNGFNINQSNLNVNVPISMFKDRFIVTLGSTLDVPLQSTIQQNVQFLPDVTAEWLINQSGTIRASFFYRQNLDYLTTSSTGAARTKRTGANIAYRKEFDTLGELFGRKKKKKASTQQPAAPPPADPQKPAPNP
ncbi:MAG: AsmA family protein [Chitinophagaceae bacterium]